MAMRVPTYERQQVVQASRPVGVTARQSGLGAVAQGLADVGQMFDQWQADVDEADAKAADTRYSDMVRKTLYEDGAGYLYAQGGDALSRRKQAAETLQKDYDDILGGLSPRAREMAERAMESRRQSALQSVDTHAGGERVTYLNGQSDARMQAAINDAIVDPAHIGRSISIARGEIAETGQRMGWSTEKVAQKQTEAGAAIHGGIISRLANIDPQQALDYLNAHRDQMPGAEVARLEGVLLPEAKRRRGRDLGRGLAQGSSAGIGDDYYAAIRSAESGGDDAARNPNSSATGRYQFIQSTWDRLRLTRPDLHLTEGGRLDPAQQERAIRAFTEANARTLIRGGIAVTNGTLYAAHFLGAGGALKVLSAPMTAAVSDIVGPAVMRANAFLDGMSVADFASWAEGKAGGVPMPMGGFEAPAWGEVSPGAPRMDPVTQILGIDDPDVRAAAMQEYQLWSGQQAQQQKAAQDAAQQAAFLLLEQGGTVDSLSLDQKAVIGQAGMTSLRSYESSLRKREPVETDPGLYVELTQQEVTDPQGFAARDLLEALGSGRMSRADFEMFSKKQAEAMKPATAPDPEKALTISMINSAVSDVVAMSGVDKKTPDGQKQVVALNSGLLRWAAEYQKANGGQRPDEPAVRQRATQMLMPVVVNPPGAGNERSGLALDFDTTGLSPAYIHANLSIAGVKVDPKQVEEFAFAFEQAMGRAPTAQEVIEGLAGAAASGVDLSGPPALGPGPSVPDYLPGVPRNAAADGAVVVPARDPGIGF